MDIFTHVRTYVLADQAIAALVGTRLYPIKLPQGATYPAMTLHEIDNVPTWNLNSRSSLDTSRFQFDIWTREGVASAFANSGVLARLLRARLENKTIVVADDSASPVEARRVTFRYDSGRQLFETDVNGGYYRHSADYFVEFNTGYGGT